MTQTLPYPAPDALFVGLAFHPGRQDGLRQRGGNNLIRRYSVNDGMLAEGKPIMLPPVSGPTGAPINPLPAGIALTPDGQRLLVAGQQADAMSVVDLASNVVHTATATVPTRYWLRQMGTVLMSPTRAPTAPAPITGARSPQPV